MKSLRYTPEFLATQYCIFTSRLQLILHISSCRRKHTNHSHEGLTAHDLSVMTVINLKTFVTTYLKTTCYKDITDCDRSLVQSLCRKAIVFLNLASRMRKHCMKKRAWLTTPRQLRQKTIVFRLLENPDVRTPFRDDRLK